MMKQTAAIGFHLQPTLNGDLVRLRPLRIEDFDELYAAARDPLIWEQHPESDRYKPEVFQRYFDGAMESGGAFAVLEAASGKIIGSTRYCNLKAAESEVEIGWTFLARAYWGGAHNREMKRLMLAHAFQFVERVVFVVGENNLRSRKALEKIGARLGKTVAAPEGTSQASMVYAVNRGEWK